MSIYLIYEEDSGKVDRIYTGVEPELQLTSGEMSMLSPTSAPDTREVYVVDGGLVIRANFPVLISEGVISEVPWGTKAQIRSETVQGLSTEAVIMDGSIDLSASDPGTYTVSLALFPYKDQDFEVIVS
jgi:hypothetical protein